MRLRPAGVPVARPGPLRAVERARLHPAVLLLYLTGYDLSFDDLRQFRQWGSRTPGHPERLTPAGSKSRPDRSARAWPTRSGMAIAERVAAATLRQRRLRPPHLRHRRRRLLHGGHLARGGVAGRAPRPGPADGLLRRQPHHHRRADRAGLQRQCRPSASRPTAGTCAISARWPTTSTVSKPPSARPSRQPGDGPDAKPTLLVLRSHIGWPSPKLTDTAAAHGSPFGADEIRVTKEILGLPPDETFWVPDEVRAFYGQRWPAAGPTARSGTSASPRGTVTGWPGTRRRPATGIPGWADDLPTFEAGTKLATRHAINQCINATAAKLPGLVAGSADLTGNNGVTVKGAEIQAARDPGRGAAALRHPRARHGRGHERHGRARRRAPRRRHLLRLHRLHAARRCGWPRWRGTT